MTITSNLLQLLSQSQVLDRQPLIVSRNTLVAEVISQMNQAQVSCALVLEQQRLVGIFTERDVVRITASGMALHEVAIATVMTPNPITLSVQHEQNISLILSQLHQHQIRHLPLVDELGQVVGIITPNTILKAWDINSCNQAEVEQNHLFESLKKSEANLAAAQKVAHVGSWEFDLLTYNITWSEEKFRIFGLDPTEPEPTYAELIEIIHADDQALFQEAVNRALAEGIPYDIDFRIKQPSGEIRYIQAKGEPLINNSGQVIKLFGTVLDITHRKLVQSELQHTQLFLNSLLENITVGVFAKEATSLKFVFWNKASTELMGYLASEVIGLTDYDLFPVEQANFCTAQDRETISSGKIVANCEEIVHTHRGQRLFSVTKIPILDNMGNPQYLLGLVEDITERKQAQEELKRALVQEQELNAMKERVISIVSHEYRTPLTTISSSVQLLERYRNRLSEEKQAIHFQRIQSAIFHLTNLVNDVLLVSKADAGKLEFKPTELDLVAFCQDLVEALQLTAQTTHSLTFVHQGDGTNAYMDEKLLRQILTNLLSNAIKYSPKGGRVQLTLSCEQEKAIFQIQDQGIGIPQEDQQHLFEPFHRATNVGAIHGTGLGLTIVKKGVELQGGQIGVKSFVGVGTTFTLTLPLTVSMNL